MSCVKIFQLLYAFKCYHHFTFICIKMVEVEQVHCSFENKIITQESYFAI